MTIKGLYNLNKQRLPLGKLKPGPEGNPNQFAKPDTRADYWAEPCVLFMVTRVTGPGTPRQLLTDCECTDVNDLSWP